MTRLAVALALAGPLTPTASGQVADRLGDLRLATAVRLALVDDARTRTLDLDVTARDGGVEVSGQVPDADRPTVTAIARTVRGVRAVGGPGAAASGDRAAAPTPIPARPAASGPDERGGLVYHTVERGDTLFGLARRYDTTVEAIQVLNGRESSGIRVGQRLRVR